ncbi:MAG TPA: hemerythrin domain-containing protein [Solirubrobacteraceae bacterium]
MKRSDALAELSRDHHQGLVVAQRLNRATGDSAAAAREVFLRFWDDEGHQHFRIEEDVLLPAIAHRVAPTHEAVVRVLTEHVDIRRRAADVAADPHAGVAQLNELGARLRDHIRHEEQALFPLIEQALTDDELAELLEALERAEE